MLILNDGQTHVVDDLVEFFLSPGENFYLLEGFAGTGKTTCINTAIKEIQRTSAYEVKVCLTAPTNKATKVLREMSLEQDLDVTCRTIYSILGLVLDSNNEIRHTAKMLDGVFSDFDLVVVDEAGMTSSPLWEVLYKDTTDHDIKVILMGDAAQLPPVKETKSKVFGKGFRGYKLTEIMRQVNNNPILGITQTIRDAQADPRVEIEYRTIINPATDQGIYLLNPKDWTDCVKENFSSQEYQDDPNSFRCLAYTNKRVNSLNRMIRTMLVGQTESPFITGERVIVKRPIKDITTDDKIHTDEECVILDIQEEYHPLYVTESIQFKVWTMKLASDNYVYVEAYLLHNDSKADYNTTLDDLSKAAKKEGRRWRDFWAFKDSFADVQSSHALTVHRSQGSTYGSVFIDMRNIYTNRKKLERLQLEYVACSRASDNLVILK